MRLFAKIFRNFSIIGQKVYRKDDEREEKEAKRVGIKQSLNWKKSLHRQHDA